LSSGLRGDLLYRVRWSRHRVFEGVAFFLQSIFLRKGATFYVFMGILADSGAED
jgi:hypothetical protein